MRVGLMGLGAMGSGMARRLRAAGLLSGIWNRTADVAQALARELELPPPEGPERLTRDCDVLVLSLADDAAVMQVVEMVCRSPGLVHSVIDTSTIAPDTSRQVHERLASANIGYLEAPVSGGPEGAAHGTLVAMAAGACELLERLRPVFDVLCARVLHFGAIGNGQAAKAVNQVMVAGINQAVTEGLALGSALGLDGDRLLAVLTQGMAANRLLERRGARILAHEFEPGFRIALHAKDLRVAQQLARQHGAQLPLVEMTLAHYRRLIEGGGGQLDITALFEQKQDLFEA